MSAAAFAMCIGTMASIALRKGYQLLAEVFDPKTWLVVRKYKFSATNPKAPVISAEICANLNHAVMSPRAIKIV